MIEKENLSTGNIDFTQDTVPNILEQNALLGYKKWELRVNLALKVSAFILAIFASVYFLYLGSNMAVTSTEHIRSTQTKLIEQRHQQIQLALTQNQPDKVSPKTGDSKPSITQSEKRLERLDKAEKSLVNAQVKVEYTETNGMIYSNGYLMTLVAFVLGIGLTLLLSLLKFTFTKPQEEKTNITADIATPLSELIKSLAQWLKKRVT